MISLSDLKVMVTCSQEWPSFWSIWLLCCIKQVFYILRFYNWLWRRDWLARLPHLMIMVVRLWIRNLLWPLLLWFQGALRIQLVPIFAEITLMLEWWQESILLFVNICKIRRRLVVKRLWQIVRGSVLTSTRQLVMSL